MSLQEQIAARLMPELARAANPHAWLAQFKFGLISLLEDDGTVESPVAPGPSWVLDHVGPQGGKYWKTQAKPNADNDLSQAAHDYKEHGTKAAAFKAWFGDWERDPKNASKVVNSGGPQETHRIPSTGSVVKHDGKPIVVYHGTAIGGFTSFDKKHEDPDALYGSGFYFTEDKEVASTYQEKFDASAIKSVSPEAIADLRKQYTDLLASGALKKNAKKVQGKSKDALIYIAALERGDPNYMQTPFELLEKMGFDMAKIRGGTPEVKALYLNIRKPFVVGGVISQEEARRIVGTKLEKRLAQQYGYTLEKGGVYNAQLFYDKAASELGDHVKANKMAMNDLLKKAGYDGITHIGGMIRGDKTHRVWIAFEPEQIKAVGNRGTFDTSTANIYEDTHPNVGVGTPKPPELSVGGFTGVITDSLGRKYHYVNGKRVAGHEHDQHVRSGGNSRFTNYHQPLEPHQADEFAAHLHKGGDAKAFKPTGAAQQPPAQQQAAPAPQQTQQQSQTHLIDRPADLQAAHEDYAANGVKAKSFKSWFGEWDNPEAVKKGLVSKVIDLITGKPKQTHPIQPSKVVDEEGKPIVMLHGTTGEFTKFDKSKQHEGNLFGPGFYFTDSPHTAQEFAKGNVFRGFDESGKAQVLKVYLNIKKPFEADFGLGKLAGSPLEYSHDFLSSAMGGNKQAVDYLKKKGYDGIKHTTKDSKGNPETWWIAFEPHQVKSVDNFGGFDPKSDNMLESDGTYESPTSPGQGWVLDHIGPQGGKYWRLNAQPQPVQPQTPVAAKGLVTKDGWKSKAKTEWEKTRKGFVEGEERAKVIREMFGKDLEVQDFATLVGADEQAKVTVSVGLSWDNSYIIHIAADDGYEMSRFITKTDGQLIINNSSFEVKEGRGHGLGAKILAHEVDAARAVGVKKITTYAAGALSSARSGGYVGYYTWPSLGYDTHIGNAGLDSKTTSMLKKFAPDASMVSEIFAMRGIQDKLSDNEKEFIRGALKERDKMLGRSESNHEIINGSDWWYVYGEGSDYKFDLDENSLSSRILAEYIKRKKINLAEAITLPSTAHAGPGEDYTGPWTDSLGRKQHYLHGRLVSIPEPEKPESPISNWLPDEYTFVKDLGGSTGAYFVKNRTGSEFVVKRGSSHEHLREEMLADDVYYAMSSHFSTTVVSGDEGIGKDGGPFKKAAYLGYAKPLGEFKRTAEPHQMRMLYSQLQRGFVIDALMGNWDVIGLAEDNILVTGDYSPLGYRIDNGGALRFRAQGAPKGAAFGDDPTELETMRDPDINATAAEVFGVLSNEDVHDQLVRLMEVKDKFLDAFGDNPELRALMERRLEKAWEKYKGYKPFGLSIIESVDEAGKVAKESITHNKLDEDGEIRKAVRGYTGSDYENINQWLRFDHSMYLASFLRGEINSLDAAIAANTIEKPIVVMRGLQMDDPQIFDSMLKEGSIFQDNGFVSTTLAKPVMLDFIGAHKAQVRVYANVPKGSHGFFVGDLADASEAEVLLPRNSKFKVKKVKRRELPSGLSYDVLADYIGADPPKPVPLMSHDDSYEESRYTPDRNSKFIWHPEDLRVFRVQESVEAPFTGIDSHGHKWVSGKQVKRDDLHHDTKELVKSIHPDLYRKSLDLGGKVMDGFVKLEEKAKDFIVKQVYRLPTPLRLPVVGSFKAMYGTYIAANHAVASHLKALGLDQKEQERLSVLITNADVFLGMKIIPYIVGGVVGGVTGNPTTGVAAGVAASFVPAASLSYLAFSGAKHPIKTLKHMYASVNSILSHKRTIHESRHNPDYGKLLPVLTNAIKSHNNDWDDWFAAFLMAVEETKDIHLAIEVANEACPQKANRGTEAHLLEDSLYSGPKPPAEHGWVLDHVGPKGGKYWRRAEKGEMPEAPAEAKPKEPAEPPAPSAFYIIDKDGEVWIDNEKGVQHLGDENSVDVDTKLPIYNIGLTDPGIYRITNFAAGIRNAPNLWVDRLDKNYKRPPGFTGVLILYNDEKHADDGFAYVYKNGKLEFSGFEHELKSKIDDSTPVHRMYEYGDNKDSKDKSAKLMVRIIAKDPKAYKASIVKNYTPPPEPKYLNGYIIDGRRHIFHSLGDGVVVELGSEWHPREPIDTTKPIYRTDDKYKYGMGLSVVAKDIAMNPDKWGKSLVKDYQPPKPLPEQHTNWRPDASLTTKEREFVDGVIKHINESYTENAVNEALDDAVRSLSMDEPKLTKDEFKKRMMEAFDKAEWTINASPFSSLPEGGRVWEKLIKDKALINQFESHFSKGTLVDFEDDPENPRTLAENSNFGIPVNDSRFSFRPKYGAVNWGNKPEGAATSYGSLVFVLNKDKLKDRVTLSPEDSFGTSSYRDATAADPINALAQSGPAKRAVSHTYNHGYGYTELQVHGPLPINKETIKEIRMPSTGNYVEHEDGNLAIKEMAQSLGIPVKEYDSTDAED